MEKNFNLVKSWRHLFSKRCDTTRVSNQFAQIKWELKQCREKKKAIKI